MSGGKASGLMPKGVVWPWWRRCLVVLGKEVRDHVRDRRSLGLALIYPLLGPLVVGLLLQVSADSLHASSASREVVVAVRGAERAPDLIGYLAHHQVVLTRPLDAEELARGERDAVILEIPAAAAIGTPFSVRLLFDANRAASAAIAGVVAEAVAGYGRQVGQRFLAEHGLDASILQPISVERVHIGRRINMAQVFYNLIPPLVVFMIFLGAVYLALDTTVGERERGTLEPLLTVPVRRWELLLGKAGAALLFTLVTVVVNLSAFSLVLAVLVHHVPGLGGAPGGATFALIFVLALPVMALAVAIQFAVAAVARSMKEAQIYLGLLPLVPTLPGVAAVITPFVPQLWMAGVPVFGQMVLFTQLIGGSAIEVSHAGVSAVVTLAVAAVIFFGAVRLYERERNVLPG